MQPDQNPPMLTSLLPAGPVPSPLTLPPPLVAPGAGLLASRLTPPASELGVTMRIVFFPGVVGFATRTWAGQTTISSSPTPFSSPFLTTSGNKTTRTVAPEDSRSSLDSDESP